MLKDIAEEMDRPLGLKVTADTPNVLKAEAGIPSISLMLLFPVGGLDRPGRVLKRQGAIIMYRKILVPLDGSKRAEKILPHVEDLATHPQATVTLLQIIAQTGDMSTAGLITPLPGQLESEKKQAESYLNSIKAGLEAKQIETRTRVVVSGPVVDAILKTAEHENVDLIAMSSHGRSGLSRVFYGSVAAALLHRIDRPLLLIRSRKEE